MKQYLSYTIIVMLLISFTNCMQNKKTDTSVEMKGNISISGAFALYPLTVKWAEEFEKLYPHVSFDISAGGAGKGITDVLSDMVDLCMFSREVLPEEDARGAWKIGVSKDAVLPTINANNPYLKEFQTRGITKDELKKIFLEDNDIKWYLFLNSVSNNKINVYTRSDACGAAAVWAEYLGKNQEDLQGTGVFGDPGMADAVKNDIWGMGYNNIIYIYDIASRKKFENLEVIPIDLNENGKIEENENFYNNLNSITNAIQQGIYPAPPARVLYLVSNGKPQKKIVQEFLKFVISDGQKYIHEAGYVQLDSAFLAHELKKLEE